MTDTVTLNAADYTIDVTDVPPHFDGSDDRVGSYSQTHVLGDSSCITSRHAIRVSQQDKLIGTCLLSAGGGASCVHKHTALVHDEFCVIAVGPFMAAVELSTLQLRWATQTDDATCFGVYESTKHNCFLSHGELMIARVRLDGTIVWQAGGADIFTNGFALHEDVIRVLDFNDQEYVLDIESGREVST